MKPMVSASLLEPSVQRYDSLDSFEGVPDWFEPQADLASQSRLGRQGHRLLVWAGEISPGILLAIGLAYLGLIVSRLLAEHLFHLREAPISPILVAIVLGLLIRNTAGVPAMYEAGLRLCLKTILRLGIVLLGLRLSLGAVLEIGLLALPVVVGCVAAGLVLVTLISRQLGLNRSLGTLIAVGTSICGVSAVAAAAPIIKAREEETSYAIGCIALFGLVALLTYPFMSGWLFGGQDPLIGLFLGTAIHDTAQVAGAALMYQQQYDAPRVLDIAVVTKLLRNLTMAAVIPLLVIVYFRSNGAGRGRLRWKQAIPLFVIGFVLMALIRTIGDATTPAFALLDETTWAASLNTAALISGWCLAMAMAAVGLGTGLARLRTLGWKPLVAGLAAAVMVGMVSAVLVTLVGHLL